MKSFFIPLLTVAGAEMGDKTQLLALVLVARFKKSFLIIFGIFIATLASLFIACLIGNWIGTHLSPKFLESLLAISYIIAAIWMFIPEKQESHAVKSFFSSVLITTIILFFLAELGDKTQIVTAILAAEFHNILIVTMGATFGMMLVNIPTVFLGRTIMQYLSITAAKISCACLLFIMGSVEILRII